ncbi:MAG: tetratricopeptide repeat protein [Pyrinomonadaceae bacterium]
MKKISFITALCLFVLTTAMSSVAQDRVGVAYEITRFDVTANVPAGERTLSARALLTVRNVGRSPGNSVSLRLNSKAEISAATVNGAVATFRAQPEAKGALQRITVTPTLPIASNTTATVALDYRLPVADNSGLETVSPLGTAFLPLAFWYPVLTTRGTDMAPFRLIVNAGGHGETVIASGAQTGGRASGSATFEQTLNAQPFFLTGEWDTSEGTGAARGINAYLPKGAPKDERAQGDSLIALAQQARDFYANLFNGAPDAPLRLVAVRRGAGFNSGGTLLLDAAVFRRTKTDSATALLIAETVARLWIGGATPVRGEGGGAIREGLVRHLATLFIEKQFGAEAVEAERARGQLAYAAVARRDAPLSQATPLDSAYFASVTNKGAMVWRLVDRALGHEAFVKVLRSIVQTKANDAAPPLTLPALRAAFAERGGASVKAILDVGLDQPTDTDLLIGVPQQRAGGWQVALRNLGSLDASVTIAATTADGKRLTTQAVIPARSFSEAVFNTQERIARVEVDAEKFYPQLDYANDVAPRSASGDSALTEALRLFAQQNFARAESLAREMLSLAPNMQEARILLARSLLMQNKADEAEREFRAALDQRLPSSATLAWANVGLGEINLRRGRAAEALKRFDEAARVDAEYASTLAARQGRIKAEAAANTAPAVDEAARAFITQFDAAIKSGRKAELDGLLLPGELSTFVKGIIGSQPEQWQTRLLRTEQPDANHLAADVSLNVRQFERDQTGTAVYLLARTGGAWKLESIEFFEVR